MKKILGLDLGTNSIGWAVINSLVDDEGKEKLTSIIRKTKCSGISEQNVPFLKRNVPLNSFFY